MASKNVSPKVAHGQFLATATRTHGGGLGAIDPDASRRLLRQVATCMLWEPTFYKTGDEIAASIATDALNAPLEDVARIAVMAREEFKLRDVPLFLVALMDTRRHENPRLVSETACRVIQRADQMAELLALVAYVNGKSPNEVKKVLSRAIKRGVAMAFGKFSEYQFAKYNRDKAISLRDVMFLVHPKPDNGRADLYSRLAANKLETPDTWEVALSAGSDKRETWGRLLAERKLGDLALLRNLRNMQSVGVPDAAIKEALTAAKFERVLPFRFVAAARFAPSLEADLEAAMFRAAATLEKLPGKTGFLIDVSGSMDSALSERSDLTRIDAASALAMLLREACEECAVATYSEAVVLIPPRRGNALRDAIAASQPHGNTATHAAVSALAARWTDLDRFILITDEQATDDPWRGTSLPAVCQRNYVIDVAPYKVGLADGGKWVLFSGFSERVVDFICWNEA